MTRDTPSHRRRRAWTLGAALALLVALAGASTSFAQEHGEDGPPSQEEIVEKVKEIERLMRSAEDSLARSTRERRASDKAAREIEKLIDEQSRAQTGKSAEDLRKEAQEGSAEARQKIEQITKQATQKIEEMMQQAGEGAGGAAEGVRKMLEKTSREGQQAQQGIEWILKRAVSQGGGGGGGHKPQPKPDDKKPQGEQPQEPKGGDENEGQEKPDDPQRPESNTQPPRDEEFEKWLATLPAQVRKAYESEDWDAVPVQYRALLRAWTKKMADELDKATR